MVFLRLAALLPWSVLLLLAACPEQTGPAVGQPTDIPPGFPEPGLRLPHPVFAHVIAEEAVVTSAHGLRARREVFPAQGGRTMITPERGATHGTWVIGFSCDMPWEEVINHFDSRIRRMNYPIINSEGPSGDDLYQMGQWRYFSEDNLRMIELKYISNTRDGVVDEAYQLTVRVMPFALTEGQTGKLYH